jgi:hypothetical protein
VIDGLKQRRAAYAEVLASGQVTYATVEATAMKYAEIVGRINEIDSMIQLMMESEEDGEDSGVGEDG